MAAIVRCNLTEEETALRVRCSGVSRGSQFTEQLGCGGCFCEARCVPKRRKMQEAYERKTREEGAEEASGEKERVGKRRIEGEGIPMR